MSKKVKTPVQKKKIKPVIYSKRYALSRSTNYYNRGPDIQLYGSFRKLPSGLIDSSAFISINDLVISKSHMSMCHNTDFMNCIEKIFNELCDFRDYLKSVQINGFTKQYEIGKNLVKHKKNTHTESIFCHYGKIKHKFSNNLKTDDKSYPIEVKSGFIKIVGQYNIFHITFDERELKEIIKMIDKITKELSNFHIVLAKNLFK